MSVAAASPLKARRLGCIGFRGGGAGKNVSRVCPPKAFQMACPSGTSFDRALWGGGAGRNASSAAPLKPIKWRVRQACHLTERRDGGQEVMCRELPLPPPYR